MDHFTPVAASVGGALIGLSAVILMLLNGRIAGVSGITAGLLSFSAQTPDRGWRVAFVVGLIAAPFMLVLLGGRHPEIAFVASTPTMIAAGLLVGFGTVLGNGCTSGHGVCGLARLSVRSIVATAVFMAAGVATTFVVRHLIVGG
jgi:uncharacterized membrane protein YedE/YeeE